MGITKRNGSAIPTLLLVTAMATVIGLVLGRPERHEGTSSPQAVWLPQEKIWWTPSRVTGECWTAFVGLRYCKFDLFRSWLQPGVQVSAECCKAVEDVNGHCLPVILSWAHLQLFPLLKSYCDKLKAGAAIPLPPPPPISQGETPPPRGKGGASPQSPPPTQGPARPPLQRLQTPPPAEVLGTPASPPEGTPPPPESPQTPSTTPVVETPLSPPQGVGISEPPASPPQGGRISPQFPPPSPESPAPPPLQSIEAPTPAEIVGTPCHGPD